MYKRQKSKGLNRVSWDLRHSRSNAINPDRMRSSSGRGGWRNSRSGHLASPGSYTATLTKVSEGVSTILDGPINFNVVDLNRSTLSGMSYTEYNNHAENLIQIQDRQQAFYKKLNDNINTVKAMRLSLSKAKNENNDLSSKLFNLLEELNNLSVKVYGLSLIHI